MAFYCILNASNPRHIPLVSGIAAGIAAILLGSLFLFFPEISLRIIIYLTGAAAFILGILLFALAWKLARSGTPAFAVPVIFGVCAIVIGIVSWLNPGIIGAFMAVIFAFACLVGGLGMAFVAVYMAISPLRKVLIATGGMTVAIIGILTLFYPQLSATVILQLVGFFLMGTGVIVLAYVVTVWRRERSPENRNVWNPGNDEW